MTDLEQTLQAYDYTLPQERIAQEPATPRDSSKILVYSRSTGEVTHDSFLHLDTYLPEGALMVFNDTKVVPARLVGRVKTGGKAGLLCTRFADKRVFALSDRSLSVGEKVWLSGKDSITVLQKREKEYEFLVPSRLNIRTIMERRGITPLPPYLKHSPLSEKARRKKYQAVFAREEGSIAAPTASLHFTPRLLRKLRRRGIETVFVTLHVNLGTFMPLTADALKTSRLHKEDYNIPRESLRKIRSALRDRRPIIPVGTTSLRVLEAAKSDITRGREKEIFGSTDIFIRGGYVPTIASGLITNFHVPRSSLLMLVSALVGRDKILALYAFALKKGFRFLSFGDGMLVL